MSHEVIALKRKRSILGAILIFGPCALIGVALLIGEDKTRE